jgi:hypothetical protein
MLANKRLKGAAAYAKPGRDLFNREQPDFWLLAHNRDLHTRGPRGDAIPCLEGNLGRLIGR